ncbi:MAG: hypothetical protein ABSD10_03655 [Candidatus Saccharimonadales bacterium]|jgi:hypothetical protein
MQEFLTRESAKWVELPLNPVDRHRRVLEYLGDRSFTGARVILNPTERPDVKELADKDPMTVIVHTFNPIYGRWTLRKVAKTLEAVDRMVSDEIIEGGIEN